MNVRSLASLPNSKGYKFKGITYDGQILPCEVAINGLGCHYIVSVETKEPAFQLLKGWLPNLGK